jgi:hypothetical protein
MKQTFTVILLGLVMVLNVANSAIKIPDGFHGEWTTSVVKDEGFPWWSHVKYPVHITISDGGIILEDESGARCVATVAFYDDEIEALVIMHCGAMKSPNAFPPYCKLTLRGQRMSGEIWTYKRLFNFVASKGGL